jgi:hypothetical protein
MRRKLAALAGAALTAGLLPGITGPAAPASALEIDDIKVVPLQITGPPSERLNLVIFGDGYTADEMQKFRDDVDRNQNVQWSIEPFRSYRNYFNVYRVETPSVDSGISCDPDDGNVRRNTVFSLQYAGTCPADPLARGVTYGAGGAAARTEILNTYLAPLGVTGNNVQTLNIGNTETYGGIGGTHATTTGSSAQGPLVSTHELGHSVGNNFPDEYPYSNRERPGTRHPDSEPSAFNHTRMSSEEMIATRSKWWRWLGEESLSGGIIKAADPDGYESGLTRGSNVWRPSQHSMMRAIGFYFDQVGREHMTQRITGMRFANEMPLMNTPEGQVGADDVLWVEPMNPRFHELSVRWSVNGEHLAAADGVTDLDLSTLDVDAGDSVSVTVKDQTEFVRDPAFLDGPRMTQTRTWTVGTPMTAAPVAPEFTVSTFTGRPVAYDEVVYARTTHPTDRVLDVTWRLDGEVVPNANRRTLDLGARTLTAGAHTLTATVSDPANAEAGSQTLSWTVDNGLPTAPRELSEPLTTLGGDTEHNVYFNNFDMTLRPQDDQPGFVVGEFRLNNDGWHNYFGFPEEPLGAPYRFSHSGESIKALQYGNLGSGGVSKATFEQSFPDFVPGFRTHTVEHRAIDAAGNIGEADEFKATVLPGELAECTRTLTGDVRRLVVSSGTTCLDGATVTGGVTVTAGASLVATDSVLDNGGLTATGAEDVQLFGTTVYGPSSITGSTGNVTVAGSTFHGTQVISGNTQAETETGTYGVALVGNRFTGDLVCTGNAPGVSDFGAANALAGSASGQCGDLETTELTTTLSTLSDLLDGYNADGTISDRTTANLRDRLDRAVEKADLGHETQAIGLLEQFVARVQNQVKGDAADTAARAALVVAARAAIAELQALDAAENAS